MICEWCGDTFGIGTTVRELRRRFCSTACAKIRNGKLNKGRKHSSEARAKISAASIGKNNGFFGRTHSNSSLRKMSRSHMNSWKQKAKICNLSELEMEVLDGLLLSDGCLSNVTPVSGRLSFGFKFRETLLDIVGALPSLMFSVPRVNADSNWFFKSKSYSNLLSENRRWYLNKKKIVPKDVRVTAVSCYWWFVCDGYCNGKSVYLCTDSFLLRHIRFLIKQLRGVGFRSNHIPSSNRIRISTGDSIKFMDWIGGNISSQYLYKWDNFNRQLNG